MIIFFSFSFNSLNAFFKISSSHYSIHFISSFLSDNYLHDNTSWTLHFSISYMVCMTDYHCCSFCLYLFLSSFNLDCLSYCYYSSQSYACDCFSSKYYFFCSCFYLLDKSDFMSLSSNLMVSAFAEDLAEESHHSVFLGTWGENTHSSLIDCCLISRS